MKRIGDEIDKIVKQIFKKQHPILAEMIINWGKIAGVKCPCVIIVIIAFNGGCDPTFETDPFKRIA